MPSAPPSTLSPSQVPVGVDPNRPSIARIYDGFLGGNHYYEVDRAVMEKINRAVPEAVHIARGNRGFHNRALRLLANQTGIRQFLDCGSGLPTAENTHQIVQRAHRDAHVVYVDNDPVVLAHGRALLAENDYTHMVDADIFQPAKVLENDTVREYIDFDQPLGLLHIATMHHFEGDGAIDVMRQYIDALAPGSFVALAHFYDPEVPELTAVAKRIEEILVSGPLGAGRFRTRAEIEAMLPGLELLPPNATSGPGLSVCDEWWPDGPRLVPLSDSAKCVAGVVGRKP
ncbi:SAM-dependent methyltransferase [Amycolatopsis sp. FDAARGOS 1241]|uniref:SAM-dependent methyltransferase n=1 Tax=Amycolatopsis sp. FDAARGOS 1241 TaxID=2778070 RepID=UPI00194EED74|nr:SAM-dependent methyltransferase [Amycolatopsis sp. FDAARGOS 1241]QRP49838.1 SAM-dependent methyltransferase [Amycolatopsis sp. FDAARGOS 1241]